MEGSADSTEVRTTGERARAARRLAVEILHAGSEGHDGGSPSMIDLLAVLFDPFIDRRRGDRLVLSWLPGWNRTGAYAVDCARNPKPVGSISPLLPCGSWAAAGLPRRPSRVAGSARGSRLGRWEKALGLGRHAMADRRETLGAPPIPKRNDVPEAAGPGPPYHPRYGTREHYHNQKNLLVSVGLCRDKLLIPHLISSMRGSLAKAFTASSVTPLTSN